MISGLVPSLKVCETTVGWLDKAGEKLKEEMWQISSDHEVIG